MGAEARRHGYGPQGKWYWTLVIDRQPPSTTTVAAYGRMPSDKASYIGRQPIDCQGSIDRQDPIDRHIDTQPGNLWEEPYNIGLLEGIESHRPPSDGVPGGGELEACRLSPCQTLACPNLRRDGEPLCTPCELRQASEAIGRVL